MDRALTYVSEDVHCFAPDATVSTKDDWRRYLAGFVPVLTGAPEHARMTDGDRVALWYFPQTAVTTTTLASELFTVHEGRITEIRLAFDRLGYVPAASAGGLGAAPAGNPARELIDRMTPLLPTGHVREVRMFGAIAVMIDDSMAAAVHKDGSLLVRVDSAEDARLLMEPGASRAEMGAGRSMGEGWIRVEAMALRSDGVLTGWIDAATRFLATRAVAHP